MDNTGEVIALIKGLSKGGGSGGGGITVKDAKVGQLIRAKAVDATGNITEYEPVPFMYEDVQENIIFPEAEVTGFAESGQGKYGLQGDPTGLTEFITQNLDPSLLQKKFRIKWDGVDYQCSIIDAQRYLIIGNANLFNRQYPNTGEPFFYMFTANNATGLWGTTIAGTAHTIEIAEGTYSTVKIPERYIPKAFEVITIEFKSGTGNNCSHTKAQVEEILQSGTPYVAYFREYTLNNVFTDTLQIRQANDVLEFTTPFDTDGLTDPAPYVSFTVWKFASSDDTKMTSRTITLDVRKVT